MAMWQDIAEALREAITRGDYPPGTTIPKETELMAMHGAGRETVRRAIIQLTAEGLVEPVRRRGTMVRARPARRPITRSRLVYRDELGYYFDQAAQGWRPLQPPDVSRGPVPFDVAARLGMASAEMPRRCSTIGYADPRAGGRLPGASWSLARREPRCLLLGRPPRSPLPSSHSCRQQASHL